MIGLTFEQFESYINAIKEYDINARKFEGLMDIAFEDFFGICKIGQEILNPYMQLVKELMCDDGEWIDYWIHELEYGTRKDLGASYKNGSPIKLNTAKDLYKFLVKNSK